MKCPRRSEGPDIFLIPEGEDRFREDKTCSFCGSLDPNFFMERLEAGTIQLGATDKSYKVYVDNRGGEPFIVRGASKFYFQHLSEEQRKRFVVLMNEGKLKFAEGDYFYVLPFFCNRS